MDGKVYAVTGGASGIGLAVARQLLAVGAKVSIADIDSKAIDNVKSQLRNSSVQIKDENIMTTVVDVRDDAKVNAWIEHTASHFGRLDGAANMAGVIGKHHGLRELKDQDDEQWNLIFGVNVTGIMHCMRAELKHINPSGGGSIVNAASIQGVMGFAKHAAYSASKHAVVGLTRSVAKEVGPHIRVNAVAP